MSLICPARDSTSCSGRAGRTRIDIFAPFIKIRVKASVFVILLLVLSALAFALITLRTINRRIVGEVMKRAETLCRAAASTAGYALMSQDLLGLDNIVYKIKLSSSDIVFMAVLNEEGEILAHSDTKKTGEVYHPAPGTVLEKAADGTTVSEIPAPVSGVIETRTPIVFLEKPLGSVVLAVNQAAVIAAKNEAKKKIFLAFGILLLAGIACSLAVASFLTRQVRELSTGVTDLKNGGRTHPLRVYSRDELGRLTESFNEMTALITMQKDSLSRSARDLEEAYVSTVRVLAAAIDARDASTLGHSTRVAQISLEIGRDLGFDAARLEELEIACLFHDVGKIKIPDSILLKSDKLNPTEEKEMMRHPEYGAEILSKATSLLKYIPAVRHHHEWYDGTGYPDGLSGGNIPLNAAIISLADVYDALTSDRPYHRGLGAEDAQAEIAGLAKKQFDPELSERFIVLLKRKRNDLSRRPMEDG